MKAWQGRRRRALAAGLVGAATALALAGAAQAAPYYSSPADLTAARGALPLQVTTNESGPVTQVDFWSTRTGNGPWGFDQHTTPVGQSGLYSATFDTTTVPDGEIGFYGEYYVNGVLAPSLVTDPGGGNLRVEVDNTAPAVAFTGGPGAGATVAASSVTIPFTLSDAHAIDDAGVRCVVDGGSPAPCTSYAGTGPGSGSGSQTLTGLTTGQHTLTVQAADVVQPGGNHGSATRTFVVDLIPPETTITAGPGDGATVSGPTSFDLSTDDPGARLECRVYPEGAPSPFGSCSGPGASHSIPALAPGRYVFEARAIDPAGNADASPARRTLVVPAPPAPTPAPSPSPTSGPSGGGTAPTPARVVGAAVHYDWLLRGHVTVLLRLTVTGVPQDGAVEARCHGRGCPFGRRRFAVRRGAATLTKAVRSHPLRPGAVFEVRVSEPGAIAKVVRFTIRDHRLPRVDATRG